jgi:hypothetical protein
MRIPVSKYSARLLPSVLLPVVALLLHTVALGQDDPWQLGITLATVYDNNALKYSDKYLDLFVNNQDPGRFHIRTSDDLVVGLSASLRRSLSIVEKYGSTLGVDVGQRMYTQNSIKNWSTVRLSVRQEFPMRLAMQVSYGYIPGFYVRHYRDDDWVQRYGYTPATFQPYEFSKEDITVWLQNTFLASTRVRLSFASAQYYHNKHFTEYDSKNLIWRGEASHPLFRGLRLRAEYKFTSSEAGAYDEPGESAQLSDDSDGSFEEDAYGVGVSWKVPGLFDGSSTLSLDGLYARRCFTTNHRAALDPMHAGRVDNDYDVEFRYSVEVSPSLTLGTSAEWHKRDAGALSGLNEAAVSEEKDYRQFQIGFEVTYTLTMN